MRIKNPNLQTTRRTMRHKPFYAQILWQAWLHTWRNKRLWIFGLFASLLGSGSVIEITFRGLKNIDEKGSFWIKALEGTIPLYDAVQNYIHETSLLETTRVVTIITSLAIFGLAFFVVSILSQGVLIENISIVIRKRRYRFYKLVKQATNSFWRLVGLNFLAKIILIATLLLTSVFLTSTISQIQLLNSVLYLVVFIVSAIILLGTSALLIYASVFTVVGDKTFASSITNAWRLFKNNILITTEVAVLLFIINLAASLLFVIILILGAIPYIVLFLAALQFSSFTLLVFAYSIGILATIALTFLFAALLTTFQYNAWVLLFIKLESTPHKLKSKLVHWGRKIRIKSQDR